MRLLRSRWAIGIGALLLIAAIVVAFDRTRPPPPDLSLERVQQSHELMIGLDPSYPPFEVVNGKGDLDGFDIDLSRDLARRLGVNARFVAVDFGGIYDALEAHKFDVMLGGVTVVPEYLEKLDYSVPYYDDGLVLVVNQKADGNVVGIESGSDADLALDRLRTTLTGYRFQQLDDQDQIHAELGKGQVRGTIVDAATAETWSRQEPGLTFQPARLTTNPYVIAARRDDAALLRAINQSLGEMRASGEVTGLETKWLK